MQWLPYAMLLCVNMPWSAVSIVWSNPSCGCCCWGACILQSGVSHDVLGQKSDICWEAAHCVIIVELDNPYLADGVAKTVVFVLPRFSRVKRKLEFCDSAEWLLSLTWGEHNIT